MKEIIIPFPQSEPKSAVCARLRYALQIRSVFQKILFETDTFSFEGNWMRSDFYFLVITISLNGASYSLIKSIDISEEEIIIKTVFVSEDFQYKELLVSAVTEHIETLLRT